MQKGMCHHIYSQQFTVTCCKLVTLCLKTHDVIKRTAR